MITPKDEIYPETLAAGLPSTHPSRPPIAAGEVALLHLCYKSTVFI